MGRVSPKRQVHSATRQKRPNPEGAGPGVWERVTVDHMAGQIGLAKGQTRRLGQTFIVQTHPSRRKP